MVAAFYSSNTPSIAGEITSAPRGRLAASGQMVPRGNTSKIENVRGSRVGAGCPGGIIPQCMKFAHYLVPLRDRSPRLYIYWRPGLGVGTLLGCFRPHD